MKAVKRLLAFVIALGLFAGPILDSVATANSGEGVLTGGGGGGGRCCRGGDR